MIYHKAAAAPAVVCSWVPASAVTNVPGGKNRSAWGFSSTGLEVHVKRNT